MRSMKYLFYLPSNIRYDMGGTRRWVIEIINRLSKQNCDITLVTTKFILKRLRINKPSLFIIDNNVKFIELDYIRPPFGGLILPKKDLNIFISLLNDVDLIYFNYNFFLHDLTLYYLKRKIKKPCVIGIRYDIFKKKIYNFDYLYVSTIGKEIMKAFNAYHTMNINAKSKLESWGLKNVYFIPNGVDTKSFVPMNQDNKNNKKFKILYAGRLESEKGSDTLYETILKLKDNPIFDELEFMIVGSGPFEVEFNKLSKKLNNVLKFPYVKHEDLYKIYPENHVFVLPSRGEGMPSSILEAQSAGLPVIGSRIPGINEIVREGYNGYLMNPGSSKSLAFYLEKLFKLWKYDYEKYTEMCEHSRENALKYDWDQVSNQIRHMLFTEAMRFQK